MSESNQDDKHREVHGYERMLAQLREAITKWRDDASPRLHYALTSARDHVVEMGELSREEAERVADWLRRDIEEAADYTARSESDLSDWLQMDRQLIESWLWDQFSAVADETRLEWKPLAPTDSEPAAYHTGEIAGPGTLICRNCGETLQFQRAGHIPPCPQCHGSVFTRPISDGDHG